MKASHLDDIVVRDGLAFQTIGRGEQPLVWLHGFLGSSSDFASCARSLSDSHRSYLFDLPGHGTSALNEHTPLSFDQWVEQVLRQLDDLGVAKADVIGYSMGGRLALHLALAHPGRFRKVVIESGSPGIRGTAERNARRVNDNCRAMAIANDFEQFLRSWYRSSVFQSLRRRPDLAVDLLRSRLDNDRFAMARVVSEMSPGVQPSLWNRLPGLMLPLLFVAGQLDGKYVSIGRRVATQSSKITTVVVRNAGHNVHLEAQETYLNAVRSFLTS